MIKRKNEVKIDTEQNSFGKTKMYLSRLRDFETINPKVTMFSHVKLNSGEKVDFHMHIGEFEIYYILSGNALYNDNGTKAELSAGDVTYTPSGEGHGIANVGESTLEFMALIVRE